VQVCALGGVGDGRACRGPSLACTVEVAAVELSGGAEGDTWWVAPGDVGGVNVAVAAKKGRGV
jgi:hypothetical protein